MWPLATGHTLADLAYQDLGVKPEKYDPLARAGHAFPSKQEELDVHVILDKDKMLHGKQVQVQFTM